jgi:glycosyltransferase involved in cell wall biosynthesis
MLRDRIVKVTFVHDHKFRKINGRFYSPGGLSNEILSRYVYYFDNVTVVARILEEIQTKSYYSLITNPKVSITTNDDMEQRIKESNAVIIRLPSVNGYKAVHIARRKKPYLIEVVGCTWDAYWNYGLKGKILALPAFVIMRKCVKSAPYVLYVTKNFLEKRYPTKGKYVDVSDVELKDLDEKILNVRKDKRANDGKKIILGTMAGVDVPYKGHEYVIRAIPLIEKNCGVDIEYQMVGAGDQSRLQTIANMSGVSDKVVFLGSVAHEKIFDWLDDIDIYLQPSMLEGLSRALVEAMSRGLPCIASNRGGNSELIENTYLVSMTNKRAIPEHIARTVENLLQGENMRIQAQKNMKHAMEYERNTLNKKREDFYLKFYRYVNNVG